MGSSGGYGGCFYDLDAMPRAGEALNLDGRLNRAPQQVPYGLPPR